MPKRSNGTRIDIGRLRYPVTVRRVQPHTQEQLEQCFKEQSQLRSVDRMRMQDAKERYMPRTATSNVGSTGRGSANVKFLVTAKDIKNNEDWMQDAAAARLVFDIGSDFTVSGFDSQEALFAATPGIAHKAVSNARNALASDLESVFGKDRKVVVSMTPAPKSETGADLDWNEYELDTTPEEDGGRAKKETSAQKREVGSLYIYIEPSN